MIDRFAFELRFLLFERVRHVFENPDFAYAKDNIIERVVCAKKKKIYFDYTLTLK